MKSHCTKNREDGNYTIWYNDPEEQNNLVEKKLNVFEELKAELKAWREEMGAQMMTKNENYHDGND